MTEFSHANRLLPMWHTVAFHDVPMFRALALSIDHIESHDGHVAIYSADRRDSVIRRFNHTHGTDLHGQQWLIDAHARDPANFAPANPLDQTSHCLRADAAITALLHRHGHTSIKVTGPLPRFALGIDLDDRGKREDCSHFLAVSHELGYAFTQPYTAGTERHHVISVQSPIATLRRWHVIP